MRFSSSITATGWGVSAIAHVIAATWLLGLPNSVEAKAQRTEMAFTVASRPKASPERQKPLPPTPPPPKQGEKVVPSMPRQANFSPPKEAAAKVAEPPAPVDLTGVTLTGDDGSGWSSMTGNGQSMAAPIRSAVIAPPQTKKSEKDSDGAVLGNSGPKIDVVALRDLAAKPSPPALNSKLLANYPQGAKRQGIAGKASILARIDADGVVRQARTLAESSEGFGAACRKTLLGSVWSPPRDRSGRAVSTQIHYTCDFRVDD